MRKRISLFLILVVLITVPVSTFAGDVYISGWMAGPGKQEIVYENRSFASAIKEFANSPLGWATAGYIGVVALKEAVLLPSVAVHGWKMNSRRVELMDAQIERYKMETKFLYQLQEQEREVEVIGKNGKKKKKTEKITIVGAVGDSWQQTPRGKQFLVGLSAQAQPRAPTYYFDTGN